MRVGVTGITGGIGQAFASRARERGIDVVGFSRSPRGEDTRLDVSLGLDGVQDAVRGTGPFDAFLCLAGADILRPPWRHASYDERLAELIRVDVAGTVHTLQAVIDHEMRPQGKLITVGWDHALMGKSGESGELYALAKAAVTGYSKSLAQTLLGRFTVLILAPGWVKTRWGEGLSEEQRERIAKTTRAQRWETPREVADTLLAMLDLPAGVLTGQVFYVNHGDVMPS